MSKTDDAVMGVLNHIETAEAEDLVFKLVIEARKDILAELSTKFSIRGMDEALKMTHDLMCQVTYGGPRKPNRLAETLIKMAEEALAQCDDGDDCGDADCDVWREVRSLARTRA